MLTKENITEAFHNINIHPGDIIMVHSSFKSLGAIENGAATVIEGIQTALGSDGTLVFPTFCQKDFLNCYKTWHLDKESDTGYLTNYFRKLPGSLRSDHPTHSVAASGKYAYELTVTHGLTGKRFGNYGDTPFAADSPFEKMYQMDAKVVLIGVDERYITFRHYAEYCYMEKMLNTICAHPEYKQMKAQLWDFGKKGIWPHTENKHTIKRLQEKGMVYTTQCGTAQLLCVSAKALIDSIVQSLENQDWSILKREAAVLDPETYIVWEARVREMQKEI